MTTATVRDLRTRFPHVRKLLDEQGEIVVTDHGRPVLVLHPYDSRAARKAAPVDYLARLKRRMPRPRTAAARKALDDANRDER